MSYMAKRTEIIRRSQLGDRSPMGMTSLTTRSDLPWISSYATASGDLVLPSVVDDEGCFVGRDLLTEILIFIYS